MLEAAVDAPARPDGAAVPAYGVYPLIILIVYVIVTGGILCSDLRRSSPTTSVTLNHYVYDQTRSFVHVFYTIYKHVH